MTIKSGLPKDRINEPEFHLKSRTKVYGSCVPGQLTLGGRDAFSAPTIVTTGSPYRNLGKGITQASIDAITFPGSNYIFEEFDDTCLVTQCIFKASKLNLVTCIDSSLQFLHCLFYDNALENSQFYGGAPLGGAMFIDGATPKIKQCWFINNSTNKGPGAAICAFAEIDVENCVFYKNAAPDVSSIYSSYGGKITNLHFL